MTRALIVTVESDDGPVDAPGRVTATLESGESAPAKRLGNVFTFEGLPLTTLKLQLEGFDGYYSASSTVAVQAGSGPQHQAVRLCKVFEVPVRILTQDGTPLRDRLGSGFPGFRRSPLVIASSAALPRVLQVRPPMDGGRFLAGRYEASKDARFDGVLECLDPPPLVASLALGNAILASQPVHGTERDLVFVVSPEEFESTLSGLTTRVLDGVSGRPIVANSAAGWAGFSIVDANEAGDSALLPLDDSGVITVEGLPPGPVRLTVDVRGYARWQGRIDLPAGMTYDPGPVLIWPSCCIEGRVVDVEGAPVSATVWVGKPRDDATGMERGIGQASNRSTEATVDGWFAVCSLPRGDLLVGLEGAQWAVNPLRVTVEEAVLNGIELAARPGPQVELWVPAEGQGDVWILVRDAQGAPVWSARGTASTGTRLRLLPGQYIVTAGQGPEARWTASVDVQDHDTRLDLVPVE